MNVAVTVYPTLPILKRKSWQHAALLHQPTIGRQRPFKMPIKLRADTLTLATKAVVNAYEAATLNEKP